MAIPRELLYMSCEWANSSKPVLLTFDDGPDLNTTPTILSVLQKRNIRAIFFVIGQRLLDPRCADIVRRASDQGHLIGNHTWSHPTLTLLAEEQVREEIVRTQEIIDSVAPRTGLVRPPYGAMNGFVRDIILDLNCAPFLWNVDPRDWVPASDPMAWVREAVDQIASKAEAIVLAHDVCPETSTHLPALVDCVSTVASFPDFFGIPDEQLFHPQPVWSRSLGKHRVW